MVETLLPFFCLEEATESAKTYQLSENNMPWNNHASLSHIKNSNYQRYSWKLICIGRKWWIALYLCKIINGLTSYREHYILSMIM